MNSSPLVVDLDGTLTLSDTLVESVLALVRKSPGTLLKLPFWLLTGRANFKAKVAQAVSIDPTLLPYRTDLLDYLRSQKQQGRRLILATAAHQSIAESVAAHLGLFDCVLGTSDGTNLKGANKLAAIRQLCGTDFAYAGDSKADLPIWKGSQAAILAGAGAELSDVVQSMTQVEARFSNTPTSWRHWLRALRPHQWTKNLLLFVPLLTAFDFLSIGSVEKALVAFVAFCLAASSTYIVNDLLDLNNDRSHRTKRDRPFASGQLSIGTGFLVATALLVGAILVALGVSPRYLLILLLYIALTLAYSLIVKSYVIMDVLLLSILYTLRILAGSIAIDVKTSSWLLAFSGFMFLSLALVKRCAELVTMAQAGRSQRQRLSAWRSSRTLATRCCGSTFGRGRVRPVYQCAGNSKTLCKSTAAVVCGYRPHLYTDQAVDKDIPIRNA
jgi:UbiA prenyltransferase family/haloacid dehalogenase-like hydrolase